MKVNFKFTRTVRESIDVTQIIVGESKSLLFTKIRNLGILIGPNSWIISCIFLCVVNKVIACLVVLNQIVLINWLSDQKLD